MKRGARSILGSLSTYGWSAVVLFVATAVVMTLWLSEDRLGDEGAAVTARVVLSEGSSWSESTLDDGHAVHVLTRGEAVEVAPGEYRVLLLDDERTARGTVTVEAGDTVEIDEAVSPSAHAPGG